MSMLRSCPDRLEFKNECYSRVFVIKSNVKFWKKKQKYSNSCVVRKKIMNETKNHNPPSPFKLNGRSLNRF